MFEGLPFRVTIKYQGEYVLFDSLPAELQTKAKENAGRIIGDAIRKQLQLSRVREELHQRREQGAE